MVNFQAFESQLDGQVACFGHVSLVNASKEASMREIS